MTAQGDLFGSATAPARRTSGRRRQDWRALGSQGLEASRALGEVAAARSLDRAERKDPTFGERARDFVVAYLGVHGQASSEIITNACKRAGITPPDDRAFGGVYQVLARRKVIRYVGPCPRFKGHGTAGGRIWALGETHGG
jgi:hypothetical protein